RDSRQKIHETQPAFHGNSRVPGPFGREPDGVEGPPDGGPMQEQAEANGDRREERELRRDATREVALAEEEKALGETREVVRPRRDALRQAAEERERAEGHDQRRNAQPRD